MSFCLLMCLCDEGVGRESTQIQMTLKTGLSQALHRYSGGRGHKAPTSHYVSTEGPGIIIVLIGRKYNGPDSPTHMLILHWCNHNDFSVVTLDLPV